MPCLEVKDLSQVAEKHITSQKAIVANLRTRKTELEDEEKRLASLGDDANPKLKQIRESVNHLRLELDGEIEIPPGSRKFIKDKNKKTAEERVEVMAALYRRTTFEFHDTTKVEGKSRTASVFGLPTVDEMQRLQNKDAANTMMTRAASLLMQRQDSRNPVDFLDTTGLEVKVALANVVEHHHIYNNVHLDENGRVQFKSFKIRQDRTTGELAMDIVPSYWNAEEHGRNTQFIGLLDGMHSGDDPVTHMHYYRFTKNESDAIKNKIKSDIKDITTEASSKVKRLSAQLSTLRRRESDPVSYEQSLVTGIASKEVEVLAAKQAAKGLISKPKATLSTEQLKLRDTHDIAQKELKQLNKDLNEHRILTTLKNDIEHTAKTISDLQSSVKAIKITGAPEEREAKKIEREQLLNDAKILKQENKAREQLLKEKGDISQQIKDVERKLTESKQLADLTEEKAIALFEKQNGFFSFDKGTAEKNDHTVYRPIMNAEIHRYYVRETLDYMMKEYGDNALSALQETARGQYQQNLLERIKALQEKVKTTH